MEEKYVILVDFTTEIKCFHKIKMIYLLYTYSILCERNWVQNLLYRIQIESMMRLENTLVQLLQLT